MNHNDWNVIYALPNLEDLDKAVEASNIVLAPYNDHRVQEAIRKSSSSDKLLNGFTDQTGRKVQPSALLLKATAPERCRSVDAIVAFRNSVALSCIVKSWANVSPGTTPVGLLWSDFFDFYPVSPGKTGALVTDSPAAMIYSTEDTPFHGCTYPHITSPVLPPSLDMELLKLLIRAWEREFVTSSKETDFGQKLFRSLQMAYQASATPIRNQASLYDWGISVALWISAFETLVHPQTRFVKLRDVLDHLGQVKWIHQPLCRNLFATNVKDYPRLTLPQRLYEELYKARNAFFHGNPIDLESLMPFGRRQAPRLNQLAPVLYRGALIVALEAEFPREVPQSFEWDLGRAWSQLAYEKCLLRVFTRRKRTTVIGSGRIPNIGGIKFPTP